MPLSLNFQIGTPCSAGTHAPVTVVVTPGTDYDTYFDKDELLQPITDEEKRIVARILLKLMINQISNGTNAQIKSAIEAKTINLSVNL